MTACTWTLLLAAMTAVESGGDCSAVNRREGAHGPLQIRAAYLADVNAYAGTSWTLEDMHNPTVAQWCVVQYARRYGATTPEAVARLHNSGPGWRGKREKTDGYWGRVRAQMRRLSETRAMRVGPAGPAG